jgi:hypothetical protein
MWLTCGVVKALLISFIGSKRQPINRINLDEYLSFNKVEWAGFEPATFYPSSIQVCNRTRYPEKKHVSTMANSKTVKNEPLKKMFTGLIAGGPRPDSIDWIGFKQ